MVVDASRSRLYLFRNDQGPAAAGRRLLRHPGRARHRQVPRGRQAHAAGVYRVNSTIPRNQLIDLYGSAAFTLNYPNSWDRQRGRSGSGIWLHGTLSDTFARPPLASKGCVVLTNPDIDAVAGHLQDGITPVIISDRIEWISRRLAARARPARQPARRLARRRRPGRLLPDADKLSIFRNPGQGRGAGAHFEQPARNSAAASQKKVQYWMREADRWKMVHEGLA